MASILTRSSVVALKKETTEGTPVKPASATDYIAIQDDFELSPSFNVLENAELKASIGRAKSIIGAEAPSGSFSHYLRASGTAGVAPNYGLVLESNLGAVSIASTEYDTASSSTVTVLKVGAGEADTFERGEAVLIKDGTNGYRIRCLDAAAGTDLTLGFQLPTGAAPAAGVNLGKAVLYKPANTGHPTLTLWHYLGNGGAVQMMAGSRVTSASYDISAGDLINGSYNLEGVGYYFNPVEITSTDTKLDFTDDDGTWVATVAAGMYKDPHKLADALQSSMAAANPLQTPTVTYSDLTGKYTIKTTGTLLSLLWSSGTNAANTIGDKIGFLTASNDTGTAATTGYTSDNALSSAAPHTPSFDAADPLAAKDNECMVGLGSDYACFKAATATLEISTPKADIPSVCAESGIGGSLIVSREVTVTVSAELSQYDASKFRNLREGTELKFQYSFGLKSGGNWIAGKCGALYVPTATVSSFGISDQDGRAQLDLTLTAFVDAQGQGEVYVNFL